MTWGRCPDVGRQPAAWRQELLWWQGGRRRRPTTGERQRLLVRNLRRPERIFFELIVERLIKVRRGFEGERIRSSVRNFAVSMRGRGTFGAPQK